VLEAAVGDYIITAKCKGITVFVGGMSADKADEVVLRTDFLLKGAHYQLTLLK
jgi:hypothetical protein